MKPFEKLPKIKVGMRNLKTAFAATLCAFLYLLIGRNPTFACIGSVFGVGNNMDHSKLIGGNRLFGTIIGGLVGMVLFYFYTFFYPDGVMRPLILLFLFIGIVLLISMSLFLKWPGAIQPGCVIFCIILFNTPVDSFIPYSINRILDTGVGVAIGILVNFLLPRERVEKWRSAMTFRKDASVESPEATSQTSDSSVPQTSEDQTH